MASEQNISEVLGLLIKMVDAGWNFHITNEVKRIGKTGSREFMVRVVWKIDGLRGEIKCRWEGFESAEEAVEDMLDKLKACRSEK